MASHRRVVLCCPAAQAMCPLGGFIIAAVLLIDAPKCARAGENTHQYSDGEKLIVWTDKVGPYNNPQETYKYDTLGLCELEGDDIQVEEASLSIGEALGGHEFFSSPRLKMSFKVDNPDGFICNMILTEERSRLLSAAIHENYWYSIYIDDLPLWAFVGDHSKFGIDMKLIQNSMHSNRPEVETRTTAHVQSPPEVPPEYKGKPLPYVFTHRHFVFSSHGNQVIEVDMNPSNSWPVYPGAPLNFTYSVAWYTTTKLFRDRTERYLDPKFFEHKVHWLSIVNSFMLCLFLCAIVTLILMKTLKRDFTRCSATETEELESMDNATDESGWKQINGDVFRRPARLAVFTVVYATGCHVACTVAVVLLFAIVNSYYAQRGATATSFVISYLCTVIVGGYEGGRVYRKYGGQHWKSTMVLQCFLLPSIVFVTFLMINTTAIMYRSTMTVPFKTILIVLVLFIMLFVPLHTVGTLLGRRHATHNHFPCRVHYLKRPIPTKHWMFTPIMIATAGLVPSGCLFIEMYFILSAVWSHNKVYYVYGFMLAVLLLLCLVLVCVSITCTYVLLNAEDHRWQWQSFLCCSATAGYIFLYTVHYYYTSTQMSGFLQTMYYFGTSINFCIFLGLFCGSLGYIGASRFVFLIYSNIKAE